MGSAKKLDKYYRQAKKDGYAARSVYKLQEMDQRYKFLRRGQRILDLGCHPGSWLQYASQKAGAKGLVVGVDIQPLGVGLPANGRFLQADLLEVQPEQLRSFTPGYHLVLSDVAPRTTGIVHADVDGSIALTQKALELALALLKPNGHFIAKVYNGPGVEELIRVVKRSFTMGKAHKPPASKAGSRELYLLGKGLKEGARPANP
jgi:23S rRNA (uridine2552-2'-O)-methyltransferase